MQTLISSRLAAVRSNEVVLSLIGFALLFACSQITIPIQPVPITLQTIAVMIIGLTFPTRAGISAIALYFAAAALGMPVLNNWTGGLERFVGPTAGYLFGFFVAILSMISFRRVWPSTSFTATLANCILGTSIIFAFGVLWLSNLFGFSLALQVGLLPFILPGIIKALLLCSGIRYLRSN
jgi:biotin transport system substrate-specific component